MITTDDNPGDSAPAADVEVTSLLTRLGAAPPDPSSPDAGVLPWAAWAALLFWLHQGGGVHLEIPCVGLHCQSSL
ncbi:hypothetical protein AERO8C_150027 [Aeromonas veronii]|uniref:Uncharacterized protein n=1 Tax=Aeromonas veronii TaxID=654 RepID=A0A653KXC5_AERVE|nr:hypothetical protein AERO8C_150027 [Aeromonas veronii]